MQRRLSRSAIERTPQDRAVDGDHPIQAQREALHKAHELSLERLGVKLAKHPAEGVVTGNTVPCDCAGGPRSLSRQGPSANRSRCHSARVPPG
jgi:hypothetical protein